MTKAINNNYYERSGLTASELDFFKNALSTQKEKIINNLENTELGHVHHQKSDIKDEVDAVMVELENSRHNAILNNQRITLNQINRSLYKIEEGSYGVCSLCEETIDIERLKVKVFAEYCISCKEIVEKEG